VAFNAHPFVGSGDMPLSSIEELQRTNENPFRPGIRFTADGQEYYAFFNLFRMGDFRGADDWMKALTEVLDASQVSEP
jgi:hypothetical protein